jgi:hypothetical protein
LFLAHHHIINTGSILTIISVAIGVILLLIGLVILALSEKLY